MGVYKIRPRSQEPQPPLLLEKVSQYISNLYCNTPPISIAVLVVPLRSEEREDCQYSSHLYRSMPPIEIAIRLPFVSQCFWGNLGGCGHQNVPQVMAQQRLTSFHASFFPFCPLCWRPLFLPFSGHLFGLFPPSKSALFCRARGTERILERGSFRMDLSTKLGKEIPSRNLREKRSEDFCLASCA